MAEEDSKTAKAAGWSDSRRPRPWLLAGLGVVACVAVGLIVWRWWPWAEPDVDLIPKSFDGSSENLKQTVIVPTLDTPIPEGKSAIWCASFQLAWNQLKDDLAKGPVQLQNAQEIADRLNRAEQSKDDLDPDSYYAAAGFVRDGIVERIRNDMAKKFPQVMPNLADLPPAGALAYGYLKASVKFRHPYFDNGAAFVFRDSTGTETDVTSFGIRAKDHAMGMETFREQIEILYDNRMPLKPAADGFTPPAVGEFALDLCKETTPNQIVLACAPRKKTLAEILDDIETKTEHVPADHWSRAFHANDTLLVPNMHWRVAHHFKELEGEDKLLRNSPLAGLWMQTACEEILFKLDRSGAQVEAESKVSAPSSPRHYHFNRPFVIYLKKRDAKHPFFVMWVDNAELLCKR